MRVTPPLLAFNRGILSPLGLARVDLESLRLAAAEQTNWMPRALGSMMLRPGMRYTGETRNGLPSVTIPFVFEVDDQARLEMTWQSCRVWIGDELLSRPNVHASIGADGFDANLTGWVDADEPGGQSAGASGWMTLQGDGFGAAKRRRQVTVAAGETGLEHAIRVQIHLGSVELRIGTEAGGDDLLAATELGPGWHSLAFTPTGGAFFIEFAHRGETTAIVRSAAIETGGPVVITTPFGSADMARLRWAQSRDVVFLACDGREPQRVERRGPRSWSVVDFAPPDGPFRDENLTRTTLQPSGLSGDITLTASNDVFLPGHLGALFRMTS